MWPVLGGLISGGASLLGGMFSSQTSAANTQAQIGAQEQMQQQTESFNASQAEINRNFQTQMSNTAYQRASADMKAAGLNPMMMFGGGSAASSPTGGFPNVGTPTVPQSQRTNPLAGIGDAVSKVVSTAIQAKQFDKMNEEIANIMTERNLIGAKTAQTQTATESEAMDVMKKHLQIPELTVAARAAGAVERLPQWYFDLLAHAKYTGESLRPGADTVSELLSAANPLAKLFRGSGSPSPSRATGPSFSDRYAPAESINRAGGRPSKSMVDDFNSYRGRMEDMRYNFGE